LSRLSTPRRYNDESDVTPPVGSLAELTLCATHAIFLYEHVDSRDKPGHDALGPANPRGADPERPKRRNQYLRKEKTCAPLALNRQMLPPFGTEARCEKGHSRPLAYNREREFRQKLFLLL
jgi:hypothetical protein